MIILEKLKKLPVLKTRWLLEEEQDFTEYIDSGKMSGGYFYKMLENSCN
jgi:hypothetical protein